jgi:hypothetical protein
MLTIYISLAHFDVFDRDINEPRTQGRRLFLEIGSAPSAVREIDVMVWWRAQETGGNANGMDTVAGSDVLVCADDDKPTARLWILTSWVWNGTP